MGATEGFGGEVLIWTEDTCGEVRRSSLTWGMFFVASEAGLEVDEVLEMTVAGLAMWKLTSAETLSSNLAIFSLDRDFIKDSSDSVFLGSFESESLVQTAAVWPGEAYPQNQG